MFIRDIPTASPRPALNCIGDPGSSLDVGAGPTQAPRVERLANLAVAIVVGVTTHIAAADDIARFIPIPSTDEEPGSNPNVCAISGTDAYSTVRVSADGSTVSALAFVGGFSEGFIERYIVRWTDDTGSVRITPNLPGLYPSVGVSADGRTIWGDRWRWTAQNGFQPLDAFLGPYDRIFSCADDGRTVSGYTSPDFYPFCGDLFRTTELGAVPFELAPRSGSNPDGYFYFNTISGDGSTIAGAACGPDTTTAAVLIRADGEVVGITPTQDQSNQVSDLSFDGRVAVGTARSDLSIVSAFRWTEAGGFEDLGAAFFFPSFARTCSADGSIVGGQYAQSTPTEAFGIAWISTPETGPVEFRQYLIDRYGLADDLQGWRLSVVSDLSADGRTIVGSGINPQGCEQAFVVRITSDVESPVDFDGNGRVDAADLAVLLAAWGRSRSEADLDGDGIVGGGDLALLLAAWGPVV